MDLVHSSCGDGYNPYKFMRNGKPRPCAVRDFPHYLPIVNNIPHCHLEDVLKDTLCEKKSFASRDFPIISSSNKDEDHGGPIRDMLHGERSGVQSVSKAVNAVEHGESAQDMLVGELVGDISGASQKRDTELERSDMEDFNSMPADLESGSIHPEKVERGKIVDDARGMDVIDRDEIEQNALRDSLAIPEKYETEKDSSMTLPHDETRQVKCKAVEITSVVQESEVEQQKKRTAIKCKTENSPLIKVNGIFWLEDDEHVVAFKRIKKAQKKAATREFPELGQFSSLSEKGRFSENNEGGQPRSSSSLGKEPRATEFSKPKRKTVFGPVNESKEVSKHRPEEMQVLHMGKEVKSKKQFGICRQDFHSKSEKRKVLSAIPPVKKVKLSSGEAKKSAAVSAREAMVESLRLYESVRRKLLQDEAKIKNKRRGARVDLQVLNYKDRSHVSADKVIGSIPGLDVGDIFLFRAEIAFVKVHCPIQGGIEYLTKQSSQWDRPVAIGIISNVGQDGEDNGEELMYMGQGGKTTDNKQIADQKLVRGNLALDGSKQLKVPVRVIRGIKDANSPSGKVYIYDGLYSVVKTFIRKGSGGFDEFQFRLKRLPNQPELGSNQFKLAGKLKTQSPSSRMNIVVEDISKGKEKEPICVENTIDQSVPLEFEYVTKIRYPDGIRKAGPLLQCGCDDHCISGKCSCISRNGDELPYLNGRYLVREKDYIFECGIQCSCSESCLRMAPEKGQMFFRLEVFRTADRGWGVRSLEMIPAGSFVCEYTGEMMFGREMIKTVINKEHVLDLRRLPVNRPYWGDVPSIFPKRSSANIMPDNIENPELLIDASKCGNTARFINHSCSPNLLVQKIVSEQEDMRFPRIKLFAMDNIPPLKELTFDYGRPLENQDVITCLCGSLNCRLNL